MHVCTCVFLYVYAWCVCVCVVVCVLYGACVFDGYAFVYVWGYVLSVCVVWYGICEVWCVYIAFVFMCAYTSM